ncbi:MAG: hypothetical protein CR974_01120 [Gammaproteobacteria bacterium]|nr:MAG: hypothetical protein CR974_01120 [Gammaproteobacteria bacterium]
MYDTHIRFDWAIKCLLRDKTDFDILSGFLSELNAETAVSKTNKVDLLVENHKGEQIIIEIQNNFESDYFYRILFGVSKVITDNLKKGDKYVNVKKVIAVHIVYFELGQGKDYVYKGVTEFTGIHQNDILQLSERQKITLGKEKISDIYPEIYLLKVNNFDDETKDTLDEWIYFFKNSKIKDEFSAKGIKKAQKNWNVMCLNDEDRKQYERYISQLQHDRSLIGGSFDDGKFEGRKEEKIAIAKSLKQAGMPDAFIVEHTGLSQQIIDNLAD